MNDYIAKWCQERHENIDKEFTTMGEKIKTLEGRLWGIIVLLFLNLGGVIASIVIR